MGIFGFDHPLSAFHRPTSSSLPPPPRTTTPMRRQHSMHTPPNASSAAGGAAGGGPVQPEFLAFAGSGQTLGGSGGDSTGTSSSSARPMTQRERMQEAAERRARGLARNFKSANGQEKVSSSRAVRFYLLAAHRLSLRLTSPHFASLGLTWPHLGVTSSHLASPRCNFVSSCSHGRCGRWPSRARSRTSWGAFSPSTRCAARRPPSASRRPQWMCSNGTYRWYANRRERSAPGRWYSQYW